MARVACGVRELRRCCLLPGSRSPAVTGVYKCRVPACRTVKPAETQTGSVAAPCRARQSTRAALFTHHSCREPSLVMHSDWPQAQLDLLSMRRMTHPAHTKHLHAAAASCVGLEVLVGGSNPLVAGRVSCDCCSSLAEDVWTLASDVRRTSQGSTFV